MSVSYRLDPEVQVQNPEGKHSARAGEKYLCILQHEKLQSSGAKCPTRSCASGSQDATKPERIGLDADLMGVLKGRTAIRLFAKFPYLRKKKLWGNHFWQRGYFVDSVGANEEIIRRYVKHQDKVAKEEEERQQSLEFTS